MSEAGPEAYFHRTALGFAPTEAAASPWEADKLSGVAMGGLLAHVIASEVEASGMNVARLIIDILGTAPRREIETEVRVTREGKRLRIIEAELGHGGRVAARATAMLLRDAQTPSTAEPLAHPLPEELPPSPPSSRAALTHASDRRVVYGTPREPGPGAMWYRGKIPLVAGEPMAPLVRAAMLGDMGSAIGSALPVRDFTFANTDIALHFVRLPRGEWQLIEAVTETAGNGHAVVSSTFSDRDGVYARGHQVLFVDPRPGR